MTRLLFLFALLSPTIICAQFTVSGTVLDHKNDPLPYANVRLLSSDGKMLLVGTTTDDKGNFILPAPAGTTSCLFRADFLGFTDFEIPLELNHDLALASVTMQLAKHDLAEVVVRGARPVVEQVEDRLLFNVASSPLKTGYDANEVLERSPNVWISDDGSVQVRNAGALLLINGRPLKLTGAALVAYLQAIPSENILRIEVKASADATTKANLAGGVVNIILKKLVHGINGSARTAYLHRGEASWSALGGTNLNYGGERWNLYFAYDFLANKRRAETLNSTNYLLSGDFLSDQQIDLDTFARHSFRLGTVVEVMPGHLLGGEIFHRFSDFSYDQSGSFDLTNGGENLLSGTSILIGSEDRRATNATLNYQWDIDTLGTSLKFFADFTHNEGGRFNQTDNSYVENPENDNRNRNTADDFTEIRDLQADFAVHLFGIQLSAGAKWTSTLRKNDLLIEDQQEETWVPTERSAAFDYSEEVGAGYLSLNKQFNDRYFLRAGLRAEQTRLLKTDRQDGSVIQQKYLNWFPSFSLARKITDRTILTASYSKRLRRPPFSLLNDNVFKLNDFRYNLGNPDLAPEFRHRWELSAKVHKHNFALFYNRVNDAINGIYFLEGEVAYYQKFNSGSQTEYGIEYNRAADVTPWWFFRSSARIFSRQFLTEAGETTFRQGTVKLRATNNFKLSPKTRFEVRATWYSAQSDAFFIREPLREVDAMIQQQFLNKKMTLRFHVRDLFQTLRFANRRPFDNFETTSEWRPFTRTFNLRLSYIFSGNQQVKKRKNRSQNEAARRL